MEYISSLCEEVSSWSGPKSSHRKGEYEKVSVLESPFLLSKEEVVEPRPSMIGPCRPAPRLIRWLDRNFVKGTGCFLCWLNISV